VRDQLETCTDATLDAPLSFEAACDRVIDEHLETFWPESGPAADSTLWTVGSRPCKALAHALTTTPPSPSCPRCRITGSCNAWPPTKPPRCSAALTPRMSVSAGSYRAGVLRDARLTRASRESPLVACSVADRRNRERSR